MLAPAEPLLFGSSNRAAVHHQCGGALLRPPLSPRDLHELDDAVRDLLTSVQRLGAFRRANAWLTSAVLDDITTPAGALTYVVAGDGGSIRVRVNPTTHTVLFSTDDVRPQPVLGAAATHPDGIELPPHGWAVHRNPNR
jgi:hypothetical protein